LPAELADGAEDEFVPQPKIMSEQKAMRRAPDNVFTTASES